jgi:hypothetical protein
VWRFFQRVRLTPIAVSVSLFKVSFGTDNT